MRLHYLDSLKIIAAFCIVVVHSGTFPEFGGNAVNLLMTILICSHSILVTSG